MQRKTRAKIGKLKKIFAKTIKAILIMAYLVGTFIGWYLLTMLIIKQ